MSNLNKYKMSFRISLCVYAVLLCLYFLFQHSSIGIPVGILCIILFIAVFLAETVLYFLWCKCPHCGKHLYSRGILSVAFCPYCGNPFDDVE